MGGKEILISRVVFKLKLKYKQTKYEENMTETSSKGALRSTTVMFLFVGLVGIWMGGCGNQLGEFLFPDHSNPSLA